jgi:hypothetical protein
MELSKLDELIRECLLRIYDEIAPVEWRGREREIVSRFCFGHLIKRYDPEYIGIEVAVPQLSKDVLLECNPKAKRPGQDVCKDIVIWREPRETTWNQNWKVTHEPLAVIEWTVINHLDDSGARRKKIEKHESDKCWLLKKADLAGFVGYAAFVDTTCQPKYLTCARVSAGSVIPDWVTRGVSRVSSVGVGL